jgi:L-methionine (R)-S-oxide reductase
MALDYQQLEADALRILRTSPEPLMAVCQYLKTHIRHFNWVGFYFMNTEENQLEIGPYAGEETPHTIIPFGTGICGQVAVSGAPLLVQDVSKETNYLACSIQTKAELVVPIYRGDELIGQIDIDSHQSQPFTKEDERLLERIGKAVADLPRLPI